MCHTVAEATHCAHTEHRYGQVLSHSDETITEHISGQGIIVQI